MLFRDYTQQYTEDILVLKKPATQVTFRHHFKLLNNGLGNRQLAAIDFKTAQAFFTKLSGKYQPKSVRNIFGTFRVLLSQAEQEGLVSKIPRPVLAKARKSQQPWLRVEQMRELIRLAAGDEKTFWMLLAETGVRIGEALALRGRCLDEKNRRITITESVYNGSAQDPKTLNSFRTISVSDQLSEALQKAVAKPESFVFRTGTGRPWWPSEMIERLHDLCRKAGIAPVGMHAWRRGNITFCRKTLGMPEEILAYRAGHLPEGITLSVYVQNEVGQDAEWPEKIAAALY